MGNFKRFCTTKATAVNELLTSLADSTPTSDEVSRLKELYTQLKEQFDRMHSKWEVYAEEITDDDVYKKCEKDYNDSEVLQGWTEGAFLRPKPKPMPKVQNLRPSAEDRSRSRRFKKGNFQNSCGVSFCIEIWPRFQK